jgi:hypothetical protein
MEKTSHKKSWLKRVYEDEYIRASLATLAIISLVIALAVAVVSITGRDVHPKYAKGSLIHVNNGLGTVRIYDAYSNHSPDAAFYEIRYVVDGVQLEGQIYEFEIIGLAEIK